MNPVNVVSTGNFGVSLNLDFLYKNTISDYDPETFTALKYRCLSPKVTILLYSNGKFVVTGGKSVFDNDFAAKELFDKLVSLGYSPLFPVLSVQNITCVGNLGFSLNLPSLFLVLDNARYNPETIGALFYNFEKGTFSIFNNGKIIVNGFKSLDDAFNGFSNIKSHLYLKKLEC